MKLESLDTIDRYYEDENKLATLIKSSNIIGLKTKIKDKNVGELSLMSLESYISDASSDNVKKIIEKLRLASKTVLEKFENIQSTFDDIIPVTKDDVEKFEFEKIKDNPISLKNAIDIITSTYISRNELQSVIDSIYAELWSTVTDMFTQCFQMSMYARQYTGSVLGAAEDFKSFAKVTAVFESTSNDD